MLLLGLALAALAQDPPTGSVSDYCRTLSDRAVAEGRAAIDCGPEEAPFEGEPTLEVCLTRPGAGRHSACRPVLQQEAALAPDGLFNTVNATSPARLEGWLTAVCASDRLTPGQSTEACREDAEGLLERSRAARVAMTAPVGSGSRYGRLTAAADAERERRQAEAQAALGDVQDYGYEIAPTDRTGGYRGEEPGDTDTCRRSESSWRDEESGDSEASYSIRCSWGDGDPETRRAAEAALDAVMRRD